MQCSNHRLSTYRAAAKRCPIACALALALSTLAGPALADSGTYENDFCYGGSLQTLKHAESFVANTYQIHGVIRATQAGAMFDDMGASCYGVFAQVGSGIPANNNSYCEWLDKDGDRLFLESERRGPNGTIQSISGTGKYKGMRVKGSYTVRFAPQSAGVGRGCTRNVGQWERP